MCASKATRYCGAHKTNVQVRSLSFGLGLRLLRHALSSSYNSNYEHNYKQVVTVVAPNPFFTATPARADISL
jgi:hypothetical protein